MSSEPTAARDHFGDIAPKFAEITDLVLFGDVWQRPGLSPRDRSLATVSALIALYRPDELTFHMGRALENGVTMEELVELVSHLAFYAGWPSAHAAIASLRKVAETRPAL
ncbi:MAG: carboxymuconolactone decarboxylase family protein [Zymomonas sp.]|nr:MAG: carboxymuconolactone decarboxylase family protein [Zymomonas sp.]